MIIDKSLVNSGIVKRTQESNKGTYGSLLTICGSYSMAGASILAGKGALRCGIGLLKMAVPKSIYPIVASAIYESVYHPVSENEYDMGLVFEKEKIDELQKHIIIPDASSLDDRLREIHREFQTTHFGYRKKAESLFTSILVSVIRYSKETPKKEVIHARDVREYLAEHISEECSADILSEIFHYHPNYINRVFKENHGTTIHNFLIRQRIKIAKELLVTSNLTLEKISVRCGFKTLAHFSQCFKNNCGMSPSQFRKMSDTVII